MDFKQFIQDLCKLFQVPDQRLEILKFVLKKKLKSLTKI